MICHYMLLKKKLAICICFIVGADINTVNGLVNYGMIFLILYQEKNPNKKYIDSS